VKILFFMRSTVYVRNFESTLRMLADRGHDVVVVADPHRTHLIDRIRRESRRLRYVPGLRVPFNRWSFLGAEIRRALDYLRYLEPEYASATKLRQRAQRKAPKLLTALLQSPLARSPIGRPLLRRVLRQCDRAIPRDPAVDAFIRPHDPDLVLVTPLVEPGSPQSDIVRSARALKVPAGLCAYSWDNLTNKGLIHDTLGLITVWVRAMADEATTLHDVQRTAVRITGAAAYDHWFSWRPRDSRDSFCARVGLAIHAPYLLYLCSSKFISHDELPFIRRWVTGIRDASRALRDVSVLVQPTKAMHRS